MKIGTEIVFTPLPFLKHLCDPPPYYIWFLQDTHNHICAFLYKDNSKALEIYKETHCGTPNLSKQHNNNNKLWRIAPLCVSVAAQQACSAAPRLDFFAKIMEDRFL